MAIIAERPLRVLQISTEYPPEIVGGMGTHVCELAHGLSQSGCQVTVFAYTAGTSHQQYDGNVAIHFIAPPAAQGTAAGSTTIVNEILSFNQSLVEHGQRVLNQYQQRPDVIHFHEFFTFPAARALGQALGVPIVGTVHLLRMPIERWCGEIPDPLVVEQEQALFRAAPPLITVSHAMGHLLTHYHHLPAARLHVVHNGLDLQRFQPGTHPAGVLAQLRQSIARPDEQLVLFAGRLDPQKGISALFAAAATVLRQQPRVRYLLVGEPNTRASAQQLHALQQQYAAIQGQFSLLGKLPRTQLALLYQIADLALVPSLYEPFGYAALEALAAGVPLVATATGGIPEIVEHEQHALLVPVHGPAAGPHQVDAQALAAAQVRLLGDPALAHHLATTGLARARQHFTRQHMVQATLQVYRHIHSDGKAQGRMMHDSHRQSYREFAGQ